MESGDTKLRLRGGRTLTIGLHHGQQVVHSHQVVCFAPGQKEAGRVAQRVDQGVDLGAQSAARAADRLVLAGFFWAPALC